MHKSRLLPPFVLQLRPSRLWLGLVTAVLLLSALTLACYQPALLWLLPVQCVLAWQAVRANGWWCRRPVQGIEVDATGRMRWQYADASLVVQVRDDSFIAAACCIVTVTASGRRRSILLLPDSAEAEGLRQLRVYLRWFHSGTEADPPAVLKHP